MLPSVSFSQTLPFARAVMVKPLATSMSRKLAGMPPAPMLPAWAHSSMPLALTLVKSVLRASRMEWSASRWALPVCE